MSLEKQLRNDTAKEGADSGPSQLPDATRSKMEGSFGQSFADVKVHQNSDRVGGSVHASAQGSDLHFASGKFNPGTAQGDKLVAHELAHVVQQRGGGQSVQAFHESDRSGLLEKDADAAADRAAGGQPAGVQFRANSHTAQLFESWEHGELGDAGGGGKTVTVKCGITLSYGQVVQLSGDFYGSPEAHKNADKTELTRLLAALKTEKDQVAASGAAHKPTEDQENANNKAYQGATAWREETKYDKYGSAQGKKGALAGTDDKSYLGLAGDNSSHFSPENVSKNWRPRHDKAMEIASAGFKASHAGGAANPAEKKDPAHDGQKDQPGTGAHAKEQLDQKAAKPPGQAKEEPKAVNAHDGGDKLNEALLTDGFGCHFLTDAFSSGHLVSGVVGRKTGDAFWNAHNSEIIATLKAAANEDYPHVPHQIVNFAIDKVTGLADFKANHGSLCLKLVHDALNATKVTVSNPRGDQWEAMGDAHMIGSPGSTKYGAEAVKLSREAVEESAQKGKASDPYAALQVVPSNVSFAGKSQPLEQFATDPKIFEGVLRAQILKAGVENPLYQLIRGNVGLAVDTLKQKAGDTYDNAKAKVTGTAEKVKDWGEEKAHQVADGASAAKDYAVDKAKQAGNAISSGASKVKDGVSSGVSSGKKYLSDKWHSLWN
jgi:Domain of unknown function (DUF4157)